MKRDNEDPRRSEPGGAAAGAPLVGAADDDVLGRGRPGAVRRRVLAAAAVGTAAVAAVMMLGTLGPAVGDTGTAASRTTPSAEPSASPTASATPSPSTSVAVSPRPTSTKTAPPRSTPVPTPTARRTGTPKPTTSPSTPSTSTWSSTVTVAGRTHRARLEPVTDAMGKPNYDLVVQTDGRESWRWRALYPSDGIKGRDRTDPNRFFVFTRSRYADLVSVDGKPVTTESIGHLRLVEPSRFNPGSTTERTFFVAVFRVPQPVGETGPYGPKGWVVQTVGGEPQDINE